MTPMVAYLGFSRTTEVEVAPEDLGCGAGRVPCFECVGTGVWDFMVPMIPAHPCIDCKGTGKVLVSI